MVVNPDLLETLQSAQQSFCSTCRWTSDTFMDDAETEDVCGMKTVIRLMIQSW